MDFAFKYPGHYQFSFGDKQQSRMSIVAILPGPLSGLEHRFLGSSAAFDCALANSATGFASCAHLRADHSQAQAKIFPPRERFSFSFSPIQVSGGQPRSRGNGEVVQHQHSNGEG
jgi:hypothetical protein